MGCHPSARFGLGQCLLALGKPEDADRQFACVIELAPLTVLAEQARQERTRLAEATLQATTAGQPRADVVAYCLDALRRFAAMEKGALKSTVYEIALLGRAGLDTSDPRKKHRLQSLPGEFSGLQLVALLYTGLRQLNLPADLGIDLRDEYAAARSLYDAERSR